MPSSFSSIVDYHCYYGSVTWIIPAGQYKADDAGAIIAGSYESVKHHPRNLG